MTTEDQRTIFTGVDKQLEDFAQELEGIASRVDIYEQNSEDLSNKIQQIKGSLKSLDQEISNLKLAFEAFRLNRAHNTSGATRPTSSQTETKVSSICDLSIGDRVKVINPPRGQDPNAVVSGFTRYYVKLTLDSGEIIHRKAGNVLKYE